MVCQSQPNSTRDLVHGATPPADLFGHPPARPIGQRQAEAPRSLGSAPVHEPVGQRRWRHTQRCLRHTNRARRPNTGRSTNSTSGRSFTSATVPHPLTCRAWLAGLDVDLQRLGRPVDHPKHVHIGETDQQLAHARRVDLHRGSPGSDGVRNQPILRAPVPRLVDPTPAHIRSAANLGRYRRTREHRRSALRLRRSRCVGPKSRVQHACRH